ncbi:hypothetical protein AMELA_G00019600 [Ameiurus melas]|uniref:Uncharacterized protein n=1 Tax=Ameiurus melas TaxID=219545 RepID=A0A7J6BB97_AMEME|nr:hypothetical protein AMELA_G00019600 [Ameiurus melas]
MQKGCTSQINCYGPSPILHPVLLTMAPTVTQETDLCCSPFFLEKGGKLSLEMIPEPVVALCSPFLLQEQHWVCGDNSGISILKALTDTSSDTKLSEFTEMVLNA